MAVCEVCGNDYDKAFQVTVQGEEHTFDAFECAIHALAPTCPHCGCRIIGHGVEAGDQIFCCAHCASEEGRSEPVDRVS
jgi:nitrite reductase/ring-hydroxylating ferredoxin subunit